MSNFDDDGARAHADRLNRDLDNALKQSPHEPTLQELFRRLSGYWPAELNQALSALADADSKDHRSVRLRDQLTSKPAEDPNAGDPVRGQLPVPHPLDADWRFTAASRAFLLERASDVGGDRVLLLGTPTLLAHACGQLDLRRIKLLDRNPKTVAAVNQLASGHALLSAAQVDLTAASTVIRDIEVAIADPPWYQREQRAFLRAAGTALRMGGRLLFTALPTGSRASALDDRAQLIDDAASAGLDLELTEPAAVAYDSPPFEQAALRASGLPGVPTDWRPGDLLTFRKVAEPIASVPAMADGLAVEYDLDRVRVRWGAFPGNYDDPDEVCLRTSPSVSRADYQSAPIWTTGNTAIMLPQRLKTDFKTYLTGGGCGAEFAALRTAFDEERQQLRQGGWA